MVPGPVEVALLHNLLEIPVVGIWGIRNSRGVV